MRLQQRFTTESAPVTLSELPNFKANVQGTEYDYFAQDDFRVRKPDTHASLLYLN